MARERMVTRTITTMEYDTMCLNTETAQVEIRTLTLTSPMGDALKLLKKEYETDTFKVVTIQSERKVESIYGMKEIDFIKVAHLLDKDRKIVDDDSEQE